MSRYVELLLRASEEIRESVANSGDVDNKLYSDLLDVERKISQLYKQGCLDDYDLKIIDFVKTNKSFRKIEKEQGISRSVLSKRFKNICNRVAYYLGSYFVNEQYFLDLQKRYNLSEEEISQIFEYLR